MSKNVAMKAVPVVEEEPVSYEDLQPVSDEDMEQIMEQSEDSAPRNSDGEELLFPDGPTMNQVEEWKSRYKDIYFTEFDEEVFIWRCLSRQEYKEVMKIMGADQYYKEERICEKCVVWPESYNFLKMKEGKAGIPTFLGEQIMEKSGFAARTASLKL